MRLSVVASALAIAVAAIACGSPTEPDPRFTPAVGTPTRMLLRPCRYGAQTATCRVDARWGDMYATTLDVTTSATWSSSADTIVHVDRRGVLSARGPGEADIIVTYEGRTLTSTFRVLAEGPPWWLLRGNSVELHIEVLDERGARLDGVLVEIHRRRRCREPGRERWCGPRDLSWRNRVRADHRTRHEGRVRAVGGFGDAVWPGRKRELG